MKGLNSHFMNCVVQEAGDTSIASEMRDHCTIYYIITNRKGYEMMYHNGMSFRMLPAYGAFL